MLLPYEYRQFLNEKVLEYLPSSAIKIGDKINMRCPLCGDSQKSLTKKRGWWYMRSGSYFCFNCSTGMSGIKFLETISGSSYEEIRREYLKMFAKDNKSTSLSSSFYLPDEEPTLFELQSLVKPEWKQPLTDDAKEYLHNRYIDRAPFLKQHLYSWKNKNNDEYILIPWEINGIDAFYQLNDFKKNGSIKYIFPKDRKKLVYGLDNVDISWPYLIVFEGVYDSLFVKNGICVGTKSITDYQLKLIRERYPYHQICISFDNDQSGMRSMSKLICKQNDFKFFKWFDDRTQEKDINDYVKKTGNAQAFASTSILEKMIVDKLMMKIWMIRNCKWDNML